MAEGQVNDHLVLICGESAGGKSASFQSLEDPKGIAYLNCEAGKKLPFKSKFKELKITDPYTVHAVFTEMESEEKCHTIIIDSLTFLMDMMETVHVLTATDTQKAWGQFAQFFKKLMQDHVASSSKNVIFTAHTLTVLNDKERVMETKVPIKGALKNNGVEAYFSVVVAAKKVPLKMLEDYENDLLTITADDEMLGYKHVFQTRLTKDTVNERIRAPMGMWNINETFIDNNAQLLMNRLHEYYED